MCVDSGVHYEPDPDDVQEEGGQFGRDFGYGIGNERSSPWEQAL